MANFFYKSGNYKSPNVYMVDIFMLIRDEILLYFLTISGQTVLA